MKGVSPAFPSVLLLLLGSVLGWGIPGEVAAATEWDIVTYKKVEHVTAESVKGFYRFESLERDGAELVFRQGQNTMMRWKVGSRAIYINSIKFSLSYPVIEYQKKVLASRMDLQKLLDPVLRPWYIKNTKPFDTVILDAGHGGHDSGARSGKGLEKVFAIDTVRRLQKELERMGYKVKLTRSGDTFVSLGERVRMANGIDKAIFVSIHYNSGASSAADGIETFALAPAGTSSHFDGSVSATSFSGNSRDGENIALATAIHAMVMLSNEGATDRGVKRARYNVLRGINKPAILLEGGFLSNGAEAARIATESYRQGLAEAVAAGILNFNRATGAPLPQPRTEPEPTQPESPGQPEPPQSEAAADSSKEPMQPESPGQPEPPQSEAAADSSKEPAPPVGEEGNGEEPPSDASASQ